MLALVQSNKRTMTELMTAIVGSVFIAILSQLVIPTAPVPITMQTFALFTLAATVGGRVAFQSTALYLIEGAFGLPVFAGLSGGVQCLIGPTAGYLWAFPLAAYVIGSLCEKRFRLSALILGQLIILTVGGVYVSLYIGLKQACLLGFCPFLLTGLFKIMLAANCIPSMRRFSFD